MNGPVVVEKRCPACGAVMCDVSEEDLRVRWLNHRDDCSHSLDADAREDPKYWSGG